MCGITQIFHIGPDQHFSQFSEIAMIFILHLNHSPRVLSRSHILVAHLDKVIGSNDGKRQDSIHLLISFSHTLFFSGKLVDLYSIIDQFRHDFRLEFGQFSFVDGIGFGDDRNNIDFGIQFFHAHQIDGFQAMAIGSNEVKASMDPGVMVGIQVPLDFQLFLQKGLVLRLNVVDNRFETVFFVDLITVADGVA